MITIISPAKNMRKYSRWKENIDKEKLTNPSLYNKSNEVLSHMKEYITEEIQSIMKIKEDLARLNYARFQKMMPIEEEKIDTTNKIPSIFAYDGIQYKNISPENIDKEGMEFLNNHLRILSGFYGILRPFDMIDEYRLEMQTKVKINDKNNLYSFWGDSIAENISDDLNEEGIVLNLASNEYSKTIEKYFNKKDSKIKIATCIFKVEKNGKLRVESTSSKKARGKMVKYIADNKVDNIEKIKEFNEDAFYYSKEDSTEKDIVFIKKVD